MNNTKIRPGDIIHYRTSKHFQSVGIVHTVQGEPVESVTIEYGVPVPIDAILSVTSLRDVKIDRPRDLSVAAYLLVTLIVCGVLTLVVYLMSVGL